MKQSTYALKLAGAAALAGSTQAYGQVIQIAPPTNIPGHAPINNPSPVTTEYYNVLTGATDATQQPGDDFSFSYFNSAYHNNPDYFITSVNGLKPGSAIASTYQFVYLYANALTKGTVIGSDTMQFHQTPNPANFVYNGYLTVSFQGTPSSLMQPNTNTYLGFQFTDSNDGLIHNGYLELNSVPYTSPSSPGGLFFLGGAYNSIPDGQVGGDITAVPEPGTISSLILGAAALAGVGLGRRRRSALVTAKN